MMNGGNQCHYNKGKDMIEYTVHSVEENGQAVIKKYNHFYHSPYWKGEKLRYTIHWQNEDILDLWYCNDAKLAVENLKTFYADHEQWAVDSEYIIYERRDSL